MKTNFGLNLIRLRKFKGFEINDISLLLGISATDWEKFEYSIAEPNMNQIDTIAKFFSLSPADLFTPDATIFLRNKPALITANKTTNVNKKQCKQYVFNKKLLITLLITSSIIFLFLFAPFFNFSSIFILLLRNHNIFGILFLSSFFLIEIWFIVSLIISCAMKKDSESYHAWSKVCRIISMIASIYSFVNYILLVFIMMLVSYSLINNFGNVFAYILFYLYALQMTISIILFSKRKIV